MAKEKYEERTKPHVNIVPSKPIVDHGKTTLTAAISKVLHEVPGCQRYDFNQIDSAPEGRPQHHRNIAHIEYQTEASLRSVDCRATPTS